MTLDCKETINPSNVASHSITIRNCTSIISRILLFQKGECPQYMNHAPKYISQNVIRTHPLIMHLSNKTFTFQLNFSEIVWNKYYGVGLQDPDFFNDNDISVELFTFNI